VTLHYSSSSPLAASYRRPWSEGSSPSGNLYLIITLLNKTLKIMFRILEKSISSLTTLLLAKNVFHRQVLYMCLLNKCNYVTIQDPDTLTSQPVAQTASMAYIDLISCSYSILRLSWTLGPLPALWKENSNQLASGVEWNFKAC
jgi:hypothetical protein